MTDLIKLGIIFFVIILAIRKKLFVGYTLFLAGILLGLLFQVPVSRFPAIYKDLFLSERFLTLYGIIVLITFLGRLLKEIGYFNRLVDATRSLKGGARTAAAVMPAMVGLMPMPGGALLSAPLVAEVLPKEKYSPEFLTVLNYWSRHVIEFCWPVYPGLILTAALTNQTVGTITLLQIVLSLIMIPVGIIFIVSKVKEPVHEEGRILLPLSKIILAVWPIILAISISAIFSMRLIVAVAIALILLLAWERPRWNQVREVLKEALAPSLFMLVFGILSFQELLEISNAVSSIPRLTLQFGLPPGVIIFALTFSVGLLTGMVTAFIGLSYPLLSGYLYQPEINFGNIYFAFLSGYLGMMLSPTHFCLILTNEYFQANLARVYRLLAPPLLTLFLLGTLLYIVGYPWRIFG